MKVRALSHAWYAEEALRMEGDGCPPPAKQAKLSQYSFQADGSAASSERRATIGMNNDASADNTRLHSTTSTVANRD